MRYNVILYYDDDKSNQCLLIVCSIQLSISVIVDCSFDSSCSIVVVSLLLLFSISFSDDGFNVSSSRCCSGDFCCSSMVVVAAAGIGSFVFESIFRSCVLYKNF